MTPVEKSDLTNLMHTEAGRNFVRSVLDYAGVEQDTYDPDTHQHAYKAGKRKVGLYIVDKLRVACPELYIKLLEEKDNER